MCAEASGGRQLTAAGTPEAGCKVAAGWPALPEAAGCPHPQSQTLPWRCVPAKRLSRARHRGLRGSARARGLFRSPWPRRRPRAVICGSSGMRTWSSLIRDPAHPWAGPSPGATRAGQARAPTCVPHANIWRREGKDCASTIGFLELKENMERFGRNSHP